MTDSTGDRWVRKRSRTRDHLARTAYRLFEARGYEAVTMEEIAVAADVAKGTLYNHFELKEALLAHAIHLQLANDLEALRELILSEKTFATRLKVLLLASARWCEDHRGYLAPFVRFQVSQATAATSRESNSDNGMIALYEVLIAQAQTDGEVRTDLTASHLAMMLHYLYFCALMRWLEMPDLSLGEEFAAVIVVFLQGARIPRLAVNRSTKR
jgi:AcrR family transcriptional regulator